MLVMLVTVIFGKGVYFSTDFDISNNKSHNTQFLHCVAQSVTLLPLRDKSVLLKNA